MKEVYIIEKSGNVNSYKMPANDYHIKYLYKYIQDNNLDIKCDNLTTFDYSEELSKLGISSIIIENKKMCIFIPEYISKGQFDWFIKSKKALKYFEISYGYINNDEFIVKDPDIFEGETTKIKDFYKHLKNNIQIQKEGEIGEYRKTV